MLSPTLNTGALLLDIANKVETILALQARVAQLEAENAALVAQEHPEQ